MKRKFQKFFKKLSVSTNICIIFALSDPNINTYE